MSIQSEIDRISGEVSDQSDLISQISAVLTSKSGGGGGDITLETVNITPSESAQQKTPSAGYDGIGVVNVAAIPGSYVGSDVTRRSSSDLTVSGATVTVPAGYYAASASKSIPIYDGSVS